MVITLSLIITATTSACLYMRQSKFGKDPSDERLTRMQHSPNFSDGRFQNRSITPTLAEGYSMMGELRKLVFKRTPRRYPTDTIPSVKTNLLNLPPDSDVLVWFGHSSYFMQVQGKTFLVDPVFSGNASPVAGTMRSFKGSDVYTAADMPRIDYLLITHDHYDHLDHETVMALKDKVKTVVCGLGVGAHFDRWGFAMDRIIEKDWNERIILDNGITLYTAPGRHFSGRGFARNKTLWLSFILQTPDLKIFMGGDGGYDTHFAEIGKLHGPFDLAILENGQYNAAWHYIHMLPDETLKAARDLKAKRLLPVHSCKFALSRHAWDEPLTELSRLNEAARLPLVTPMIGQAVNLKDQNQTFTAWWKHVN